MLVDPYDGEDPGSWPNEMRSDGSVDGRCGRIYGGSGVGISGWRCKANDSFSSGVEDGAGVFNDRPPRRKVRVKVRKKGKKDGVREGEKASEGVIEREARNAEKAVRVVIGDTGISVATV